MDSKTRILVIEDHAGTARGIRRILEREGYEVISAFEGATGLRKAAEEHPALIMLDVRMPGMDGYEVCRRLKQNPVTAKIAVLMLTGMGRIAGRHAGRRGLDERLKERQEAFDSGVVEFLTKPIDRKELVRRVKGLLWAGGLESSQPPLN